MRAEDTEALIAFADALNAIEPVARTQTADTGKYSYKYADLGDVLDECKRACALFGLSIAQEPTSIDGMLAVRLTLIHKNGGRVELDPLMMTLPKEAQPFGSALTYARRYQLLTTFGIAPEDDDGKAATVAAQTSPGRRTEAERLIREGMAELNDAHRRQFIADFKAQFGASLGDLPASKHGEALTWARSWHPPTEQADEADEQWKAEAAGES